MVIPYRKNRPIEQAGCMHHQCKRAATDSLQSAFKQQTKAVSASRWSMARSPTPGQDHSQQIYFVTLSSFRSTAGMTRTDAKQNRDDRFPFVHVLAGCSSGLFGAVALQVLEVRSHLGLC